MKKLLLLSLFAFPAFADTGVDLATPCLDCHEFAFDFEGCDTAEMVRLITGRRDNANIHKPTAGLTSEEIAILSEYISAEANKEKQ